MVWRFGLAAAALALALGASAARAEEGEPQVSEVVVTGRQQVSPAVDRSGSLGLLGDRDFIETPFSVTSYSGELVKDLGARTLAEVLESSPAFTRTGGRFDTNDEYNIRGFALSSNDASYDGLYGLASFRNNPVNAIERIDLLKGPNALLNGVPPSGAIGGSVNIVPKRAGAVPLNDVEFDYLTGGNVGGAADISRRFGPGDAFGARVNLGYRDGDTALEGDRERQGSANLALDWRGQRARVLVDLTYDDLRNTGAVFAPFTLVDGLPVPKAPDNATNPAAPFTYIQTRHAMGLIRGEYDLAKDWTISLGYGAGGLREREYVNDDGPLIVDTTGTVLDSDAYRDAPDVRQDGQTVDAKLHGRVFTGPIVHDLAASGYWLQQDFQSYGEADVPGVGPATNLYAYRPVIVPPSFVGADRGDYVARTTLAGAAVSDTLSALSGRVQLTAGVRAQRISAGSLYAGTASKYDKTAYTPAFAFLVRPLPQVSLYANYIEALTQAPSAPDNALNRFQVFPPARSKQEEVGAKLDLKTFGATLAFFDITEPSGVLGSDDVFRVNGEERHRGVELEGFGTVLPGVRILGGASYLDATLENTEGGEFDGRAPTNVPDWVVSAGAEWDTPIKGFTLTGRLVHNGRRYIDQANALRIPAWDRLDLGARYAVVIDKRPVTFRANVTNALGDDYFESGNGNLVLGPPRYASLSATVDF